MRPRSTIKSAQIIGVSVSTVTQVMAPRLLRRWGLIECLIDSPEALRVALSHTIDTALYLTFDLQQGERVVFSRFGDMPWDGMVLVWAAGGGTATYRGGEVYEERP